MDDYYHYKRIRYRIMYWSSYITMMLLVVNVKFIWNERNVLLLPYVPFKIIGGQISHTWVMFPHLGIHIQSFTHLLVLNYNFLTLRVCLLLISQQTFLYGTIFFFYNVWNNVQICEKTTFMIATNLFSYLDNLNFSFMNLWISIDSISNR